MQSGSEPWVVRRRYDTRPQTKRGVTYISDLDHRSHYNICKGHEHEHTKKNSESNARKRGFDVIHVAVPITNAHQQLGQTDGEVV